MVNMVVRWFLHLIPPSFKGFLIFSRKFQQMWFFWICFFFFFKLWWGEVIKISMTSKEQTFYMIYRDMFCNKIYLYCILFLFCQYLRFSFLTVHGGWSDWVRYGKCNAASCQTGQQLRTRVCNNPRPRHKGLMCRGNSVEQTECFNNDGTCKSLLPKPFFFLGVYDCDTCLPGGPLWLWQFVGSFYECDTSWGLTDCDTSWGLSMIVALPEAFR